jgi:hypothetical protein
MEEAGNRGRITPKRSSGTSNEALESRRSEKRNLDGFNSQEWLAQEPWNLSGVEKQK